MKCRGKTNTGANCTAYAMANSEYCFTHNPATRDQHLAATRKGGAVSPKQADTTPLPVVEFKDANAIVEVLADTINRVRVVRPDGSMDVQTANAVGHLCGQLSQAYKIANLESRLNDDEPKFLGLAELFKTASEGEDGKLAAKIVAEREASGYYDD